MRRLAVIVAVGMLALAAGAPLGAVAGTRDSPEAGLTQAQARLDAVRQEFARGGIAGAVLAAARSVGVDVPQVAAPPAAVSQGTPPSLVAPVSALQGAVSVAAGLVHRAIHITPAQAATLMRENDALLRALNQSVLHGLSDSVDQSLIAQGESLQAAAAAAVDRATLYAGALLIARTIDQWLPSMRAAAATASRGQAAPASGCDVVDEPPVLCIGSGHNHYTQDYALLISEGGHDLFTNSAGGADPADNGLPVSIAIDLGGSDQYLANDTVSSLADLAGGVQGAGSFGIGMLVDAGGGNTYTAASAAATPGSIDVQGSAGAGVGILDDMGGNSSFYAEDTAPVDISDVSADGFATVGGMGILMEGGNGSNTFGMHGQPTAFTDSSGGFHAGTAQTRGFAWGVLGAAALWSDANGSDSMQAEALSPVLPPDTTQLAWVPNPVLQGFGFATTGGAGTVLTGSGDKSFSATSDNEGSNVGEAITNAFGFGGLGASGALYDAGGNSSSFSGQAIERATTSSTVDDTCGCSGVTAKATANGAVFMGDGAGAEAGTGLLEVGDGDTVYRSDVEASASATAVDDRTRGSPTDSGAAAIAFVNSSGSFAQGWGGDGAGYLVNGSGNDTYTSEVATLASANASAPHLPADPVTGSAQTSGAGTQAQAASLVAGEGQLSNKGGSDTYTVSTTASAAASPPTHVLSPAPSSIEQGGVEDSFATFTDGSQPGTGDIDTYHDTPVYPACQGTRGSGFWVDCGAGLGTGIDLANGSPPSTVPETPLVPGLWASGVLAGLAAVMLARRRHPRWGDRRSDIPRRAGMGDE